jgi:LysR family transcriptional regulator, benzoate and cis,cis-muconate-responsive activator of ben and cat genes
MIELRHLRYFIAVAEELHFGRAAQRLHIAQPGLSQQIQALESQLGVSLLARTRRRVELTAAGRVFLEEGRRALVQLERAENLARRASTGDIGRLTIGGTESATWVVLPELLREFRKRYQNVDLAIREMPSPLQLEALRNGEIDVGFVRPPISTEGVVSRTVLEERLGILLPKGHALAKRAEIPIAALRDEPLVIHPARPSGWADFMVAICRNAGFEPRIAQEASETATAVSFVAAGLGSTIVPVSLKGLVRPGVVYRPVSNPAPRAQLLLVYRSGVAPPTLTRLLEVAQGLWPGMK